MLILMFVTSTQTLTLLSKDGDFDFVTSTQTLTLLSKDDDFDICNVHTKTYSIE